MLENIFMADYGVPFLTMLDKDKTKEQVIHKNETCKKLRCDEKKLQYILLILSSRGYLTFHDNTRDNAYNITLTAAGIEKKSSLEGGQP